MKTDADQTQPKQAADILAPSGRGLDTIKARIDKMRQQSPLRAPGEPAGRGPLPPRSMPAPAQAGPEEKCTKNAKCNAILTYHVGPLPEFEDKLVLSYPDDIAKDIFYCYHIHYVLKEYAKDALSWPFEDAYEKYLEIMDTILKPSFDDIPIDFDDAPLFAENDNVENDSQETTDTNSVERLRKKRFCQLSQIPQLAPAANVAIRSCLFTIGSGPRKVFPKFTPLPSWHKDLLIEFEGEELRQEECTLWIVLCKIAASNPHLRVKSTIYNLLKIIKKKDTGGNRKVLREQLLRLYRGKLHVKLGKSEYYGSILPDFAIDEDGKIIADLSRIIAKFLGIYDFSMFDLNVRLSLGNTGQWFHLFLKSQAGPEVIIPWEKIHSISGTNEKSMDSFMRNFRRVVIKPLEAVGFIVSAHSRQGRLIVVIDKSKG